jgi:glycosyltransferase involved in cell wall biosynthesis
MPGAAAPPTGGREVDIGIIAPPWVPVPPPAYGGIEQVVALQAEGLSARGHRVAVAAAPGSRVDAVRLVAPLAEEPDLIGTSYDEWLHVVSALEELRECEVLIDHCGFLGALLAGTGPTRAFHVVHGPLTAETVAFHRLIADRAPRLRLIAISEAQRRAAPDLPFAGVCHNALATDGLRFTGEPGDHLAFLGRMTPDKGAAEAIGIARAAGLPLRMAAKCREPAERAYFAEHVEPLLGDDVEWLGEVGGADKYELLAGARGLIFPIDWEEPFGLVMIEAMACGTPVVATPRGAVPEVVEDGVTGFIRPDHDGLVDAVGRLGEIDRARCRAHVEERFSVARMTDDYERVILAAA